MAWGRGVYKCIELCRACLLAATDYMDERLARDIQAANMDHRPHQATRPGEGCRNCTSSMKVHHVRRRGARRQLESSDGGGGKVEGETGGGDVDRRRETYVKASRVGWVCEKTGCVCLASGFLAVLSILVDGGIESSRDTTKSGRQG